LASADAEKMTTIHNRGGNQYFANLWSLGTPDESGIWRARQPVFLAAGQEVRQPV
jgi:hypothetical protein